MNLSSVVPSATRATALYRRGLVAPWECHDEPRTARRALSFELAQAALGSFDEGRSQDEILRGIPGDEQFREDDQVGAECACAVACVPHQRRISGNIADDGIALSEGDRQGHGV